MKIVVMEKIEMSNEQINRLKRLGDVTSYHDSPNTEQAIERAKDAGIIIVDWAEVNPLLGHIPKTKLIALMSTGYAWVDTKKARSLDIAVTNIPGYATEAVAEHAFGLMVSVFKHIVKADKGVKKGEWEKSRFKGSELKGKTLGIIGLGRIGSRVAEIAKGFGMEVIANNTNPKSIPGVEMVELSELLKRSDVVTLHCDLNPTSEGLIGEDQFNLMKSSATLINTSIGKLVDTEALVKALKEKKIAGAGIDRIEPEKLDNSHPLLQFDNVVITPHIAFNTSEALSRRVDICIDNIEAFIKGKPQNVVN